jgi:hypothetical protein
MTTYRTHLIIGLQDSETILNLSTYNKYFKLKPEPSKCYWENINKKSTSHHTMGYTSVDLNEKSQNELLIIAESKEIAENIISKIFGGMLLAYPEPSYISLVSHIIEYDEAENYKYLETPFKKYFKLIRNIGFGCQVANLILDDKITTYAVEKFKISLEMSSFILHYMDPRYGKAFSDYSIQENMQTRSAFSIIAAFSVIEELGLEIRSSSKKPRFIDNSLGIWNVKVLENIKKRLQHIGVLDNMTFDWLYRGQPSPIEEDFKPFFGYDSEWISYGEEVRDKTLTFPEAIHNASYLRNFIAAHKFNELTQFISPYDVYNVQALARNLILFKLGLWSTLMTKN